MANTIFFSWQADHAYKSCKNIVEAALQRALVIIHQNLPIDEAEREEFEIDKDTKGVPGMPEIVATIFKKIDASAMFVADLTFVGKRADGRPTPNPNVLIEYGWALRALGHGRMIAVMNSAYGEPTQTSMPFDMKHLRFPITFNCPDDAPAAVRKVETEKLAKNLAGAIESILESDDFKVSLPKPSELEQFMPMVPRDGKARFRDAGHSLGVQDNQVSRLLGGTPAEVKLRAGGAFWFRVIPTVRQGRTWTPVEIKNAASSGGNVVLPMGDGEGYRDFGFCRAGDGWGVYAMPFADEEEAPAAIMIFKTGELWTIDTYPVQALGIGKGGILYPIPYFTAALKTAQIVLRRLGIAGPLKWEAGLEGVRNRWLVTPLNRTHGPFLNDVVFKEGLVLEDQSPQFSLKPFFDEVFTEAGVSALSEY